MVIDALENQEQAPIIDVIPTPISQDNLLDVQRPINQEQNQYIAPQHKKKKQAKQPVNKRTLTSSELMNLQFDTLHFDEGWENFLQNPAKNMRIGISGKPKNGKTAGACQLAAYLTKFGNVLYNFADQGYNKNTLDLWALAKLDKNPNAEASDFQTLEDLDAVCASGKFQFIFIDLINGYIDRSKIKPHEFEDRFLKKYPNISFILIFEVTKQGSFKGDQKWMHLVDAIIEVKDYLMESRGRYGNGYHIVWEEQFKKINPKKYAELVSSEETNVTNVLYL